MILLRSQNSQQRSVHSYSSNHALDHYSTISKQQPPSVFIYPCCYEIYQQPHLDASQNLPQNHVCMLREDHSIPYKPFNIRLELNSSSSKTVNQLCLEKTILSCSVCQKSSNLENGLIFYNCLQCKKQFCQKCSSEVHSKGKFLSHQILKLKQNQKTSFNEYNFFSCQTHLKPRKHLLRNNLVCEICFKEQSGKLPSYQPSLVDPSFVQENMKFSLQYFNEIYHNQANKMTELKQNLNKIYNDCLQRLAHKYKSSLGQIEKIETKIKSNFTQNITQLTKLNGQVQLISNHSQSFVNVMSKQVLNSRISLIQQKMVEIQSQFQQLIGQISYDYKIGDKDKKQQLIEQFLKFMNLVKKKRQQEDVIDTNRSSFRNNMKTSRTTSQLSSNRLNSSKDNRCQSSFNKHQNMSSSKHNSSLKQKERLSFVKKQINQDMNLKNTSMSKSIISQNRNSMTKSINRKSLLQSATGNSRNNSALFNQKEKNYDVKELQKAEYQDLNINLKKIMGVKRVNESQTINLQSQNGPNIHSESTSLQKNNKENDTRRNTLIRENEKSGVSSGSFLKVFDQKNRSGGRKNYLVTSGEELLVSESRTNNVQGESIAKDSPENQLQIKRKKIKDDIFSSNKGSSGTKFSEVQAYDEYKQSSPSVMNSIQSKKNIDSKNSQKQRQNQQLINRNNIFDNLVAFSQERKDQNTVSDFNSKSEQDRVFNDMTKSIVSQFSCVMNGQTSQSHTYEKIKDVQINESINLQDQTRKFTRSPKTNKSIARPQASKSVFKDSTNTLKGTQKIPQQKTTTLINEKQQKKKPDFMDMRQKMRKPNYLSTRLNSNLNGPNEASRKVQHGKK